MGIVIKLEGDWPKVLSITFGTNRVQTILFLSSSPQKLAIHHQLFKGNEYAFWLAAFIMTAAVVAVARIRKAHPPA